MSTLRCLVLGSLLLAACATTRAVVEPDASPRTGAVRLDLVPAAADTLRTFPALVEARLPGADRMARSIRHELGEAASLEVRLCVATAGHVESIAITRGSRLPAFDAAVIADARAWRFAALPGPAHLRTCEQATVTYRPRA